MRSTIASIMIRACAAGALLHTVSACKPKPGADAAQAAQTSAPAMTYPATYSGKTARRLVEGDFVAPQGYSIQQKLACQRPTNGESWGMMCRAVLNDPKRGGQPAIVQIQLYDQPVDFATAEQPFNDHVSSLHADATMLSDPTVTKQLAGGGEARVHTACHQGRGKRNSPAYCAFMPPVNQALLVVGVKPLKQADASDDDTGPEDLNHAHDIALGLLGAIDPD